MKPLQSVQRRKRQPGFAFQLNCHLSVTTSPSLKFLMHKVGVQTAPTHRDGSWGKRGNPHSMLLSVLPYDESPRKISGRGPGHLCLWSFRLLGDSKINVFPGIGCHLKFRFNVFWTPFWLVWFKPQFWMIWDGFPSWLKLQRVECIF